MLYKDFLKTVSGCPFCKDLPQETIKENEKAFLKCALAPYTPYHLLAVPKRHVTDYLELTPEERDFIDELLADGIRALENIGIFDYSVMVRSGDKATIGKSVDHIHFHIVPKIQLGMININGEERVILTQDEVVEVVGKVKGVI